MIKAGFFECDITPPYYADCPGDFGKRKIRKISDPLSVRAMALDDGRTKAALVGIDNIGVGKKFLMRLQENLPDIKIIFSASHTHYAGNLRDDFPGINEADDIIRRVVIDESVYFDESYYEYCLRQCRTAIVFAFENLQEVEFSFGKGKIENMIFNRRIRMKDGSVKTHAGKGNPDSVGYAGPVDDELGVVGVWKKGSDELLGFALNFSCHACINLEGATADFCGVAIDTVRGVYGKDTGAVYINGASGDVTQIDNMSLKKDVGKPIAIKLGRIVGGEAVKILAFADKGEIETLQYLSEVYNLKRNVPDSSEFEEMYEKLKVFENSADYKIAKKVVLENISYKLNPKPSCELAVLQIGPLIIGSTPGEMFAQFGLDFKQQSKFPFTWFSQLSYGMGYIPTADAFDPVTGGGYEAAGAIYFPETGDEITAVISRLSQQLTPEKAPECETVPPVKTVWDYNFKRKKG